jgi:hypothetical protein
VAVRLAAAHELEQAPHVRAAEAARGLVEDEDAAADGEGARDLDELLLGTGEPADGRRARCPGAERREHVLRRGARDPPARAARAGSVPEHDVLHHREVRGQRTAPGRSWPRRRGAPRGDCAGA